MLPKDIITILSVDPGGNLGLAITHFDTRILTLRVEYMTTFDVDKGIRYDDEDIKLRYTREQRKARYLKPILMELLHRYNVDAVIYESSYFANSLNAYSSLKFYGDLITNTAKEYDWDMEVQAISPSRVKSLIGVDGRSGEKDLVAHAIAKDCNIIVDPAVLWQSTEHAVDAVAIANVIKYEFSEQQSR